MITTEPVRAHRKLIARYRDEVNLALGKLFPLTHAEILNNACGYALSPGGKRLRPMLTLICGELFCKRSETLMQVALSLELVHIASLVLDDLPVMDNAIHRHGKVALHHIYNPEIAILCAHSLVSHALYLPTQAALNDQACRSIITELSYAIGPRGMAGGQAEDLNGLGEGCDDPLTVVACKTGYLFQAACYCGAIAGGADERGAKLLREYGKRLGIAYQIADDIHDQNTEDDPERSVNYVTAVGSREAEARLNSELMIAEECISGFKQDGLLHEFLGVVRKYAEDKI